MSAHVPSVFCHPACPPSTRHERGMTQIKGRGMVEAKRSTAQLKAKVAWRVRLEELEAKKAQEAREVSPAALAAAAALTEEIEAKRVKKARKAAKAEAAGKREAEAEAPTATTAAAATTAADATAAAAAETTAAAAAAAALAEATAAASSAPAPCPYKVHTYSEDGRRTGIVEKSALLELSAAPLPGGFEDIHSAYGELGPAWVQG